MKSESRPKRSRLAEIRRAAKLTQPKRWLWVTALFMVFLRVAMQVVMPLYTRGAIDSTGMKSMPENMPVVIGIITGLGFLIAGIRILYTYGAAVQNEQIASRVTCKLFTRVARAPLAVVNGRPASYWQNRIQGDVRALSPLYPHNIVLRLSSAVSCLLFAGLLVFISWELFLCLLLVAPIGILLQLAVRRRLRAIMEVRMEISASTSSWLADVIGVMPLVKLAGAEDREADELVRRLDVGVRESKRSERTRILGTVAGSVARWSVPLAVYLFGAWLITIDAISIGDLVSFSMFALMVNRNAMSTTRALTSIDDGLVALDRLSDVLDLTDEVHATRSNGADAGPIREIVFENVSFAYPPPPEPETPRRRRARKNMRRAEPELHEEVEVLTNVNLTLRMGEPAILVGESGSGKSTVMKLLCGLYNPTSGRILVDGVDLRELDVRAYRRQLSQVSHEGFLLGRDFFENVLYRTEGRENDDPELDAMIENLRLGVVSQRELKELGRRRKRMENGGPELLPEGLSAPGVLKVSAGERQRVAIVRELLHGAHVWGLDEATSNLDGELEDRVLDQVLARENLLMLAVSHRFSCIRRFPLIHVLDGGRIVASGGHHELIADCSAYQRLVLPQMRRMNPLTA